MDQDTTETKDSSGRKAPKLEISVLGQSGAGKWCLISRFLDSEFDERVIPTIGQALRTTNTYHRGKQYCLQIEDTAGQELFRSIAPASLNGLQGVVLVFDLTDRRSLFVGIPEMEQLVKEHAPDSISRILVGNKADLADDQQSKRKITREEAERVLIPKKMSKGPVSWLQKRSMTPWTCPISTLTLAVQTIYTSTMINLGGRRLVTASGDGWFLEMIVTSGYGNGNAKCNTATAGTTIPTVYWCSLIFRATRELTFSIIYI